MQKIDYNAIAATYAVNRNASEMVIQHILGRVHPRQGGNILEIGCGTADHLYVLARTWKTEGFGFDASEGMIAEARVKNPGLNLVKGDANQQFPYGEMIFDFAYSINVIHYIRDLANFYQEARRMVKKSAFVLTVTDSEEDIRRRGISTYFPETIENELKRYPSVDTIKNAMRKAGFTDIGLSHAEREYQMDEDFVNIIAGKAYSCLRLISEDAFQNGLERLRNDVSLGTAVGREVYTFIWGAKRD